jgi:gp32 DNA binding protein like
MTTSTLSKMDLLRAALASKNDRSASTNKTAFADKELFRFYDAPVNTTTTLRFLPDANKENIFFWKEKQTITIPFTDILGHESLTGPVEVKVPCSNMFEKKSCPVIRHILPWWKGSEEDIARARIYYKKSSFVYTGFVVDSSLEETEENKPENIIRRFELSNSIHKIIESSLADPEMEDYPTDFIGGRDFLIKKTQNGQHANYGTSTWRLKSRDLNDTEMNAINEHGLADLSTYLGVRPTSAQSEMIYQMFQDSLGGLPFDFKAFGSVFRPYKKKMDNFVGDTAAVSTHFSVNVDDAPSQSEPTPAKSHADLVRAALAKHKR